MTFPRSPFDTLGELVYFPRMLDKIRLKQRGELADSYWPLLGQGFDGRLCSYMGLQYEEFVRRVEGGASDEDILQWTRREGIHLNDVHIFVWNGFSLKRGWQDDSTPTLQRFKQELGIENRDDIRTMMEYMDFEEQRRL